MKTIVIAGRTGKDAEMRRTQDGTPVLTFAVAVDDGYGERKSTIWFDCSLFGKRGEGLQKHMLKGTAVTVSGELGRREYEGKTYLQVRVNDVTLQGGGKQDGERHESKSSQRQQSYAEKSGGSYASDLNDEIPFAPEWR